MSRRRTILLAAWVALASAILAAANHYGFRINLSASMPYGLWRKEPLPPTLERGMIVVVCLPLGPIAQLALERRYIEAGTCPSGAEPLLKPIAAVEGDIVDVSATGIAVNGELVPHSMPRGLDKAGDPLTATPSGEFVVPAGQVWLVVRMNDSFDSRYFGPVSLNMIIGQAKAVITWP